MNTASGVQIITYRSWEIFLSQFALDLFPGGIFREGNYLFRGQGAAEHKLSASFDRRFEVIPTVERVNRYSKLVEEFKDNLAVFLGRDVKPSAAVAIGQHHGLPTRLLDWTRNPLVALYFAFHHAASATVASTHVALWALNVESDFWKTHEKEVQILPADVRDNERAKRQDGLFTHLLAAYDHLDEFVLTDKKTGSFPLRQLLIPSREAPKAFAFLNGCGIRATTLFPDIDGVVWGTIEKDWMNSL